MLVEKAFTVSSAATREVAAAARATGVFAMEAMWTRFFPAVVRMRELIDDGAIGEVRSVEADLGVRNRNGPEDRFWSPELGGGALFDLGVYVMSFAQMVLGAPTGGRGRHGDADRRRPRGVRSLLGFDGRAQRRAAAPRCVRDARRGAGVRHRRLDRGAAPVPPPGPDRRCTATAPTRRRSVAAPSAAATRTS